MKKGLIALMILCTGLLALTSIVGNPSFAINEDNSTSTNITNKIEKVKYLNWY